VKISFMKVAAGILVPASDIEAERMTRFPSNEVFEIEIKLGRNPAFHSKAFAFLNYCFEFWKSDNNYSDERTDFDVFRENLTVLAGYKEVSYTISGDCRVKGKSLSFASMDQEEFESFYNAAIQAAMNTIFKNCGENEYNKLVSFF